MRGTPPASLPYVHPDRSSIGRVPAWCVIVGAMVLLPVGAPAQTVEDTGSCDTDRLITLALEADREDRVKDALVLLDSALFLAEGLHDNDLIARILVQRGTLQQKIGFHDRALADLYRALDLDQRSHDQLGLAEVTNNIGSIHHLQGNRTKALDYYTRSYDLYEALGQRRELGKIKNNFGALCEDEGRFEDALAFHRQSLAIWLEQDEPVWMAISYMHIGSCLGKLGHPDSALSYLELSRRSLESSDNSYLQCIALLELGDLHLTVGKPRNALRTCDQALEKADTIGALLLEQRACGCLYRAHEAVGDIGQALAFHKRFVTLRDSVDGRETAKELTRIELAHGFAQKQLADSLSNAAEKLRTALAHREQVAREREQRNVFLFGGIGVLLAAGGLWNRARNLRRSREAIRREKKRSDDLLLNILPEEVADELKARGEAEAKHFDTATILFTDFKGFTQLSEQVTPAELVAELNTCFKAFDALMEKYRIEKIKTIGDAYMAAGGLPDPRHGAPADVIRAALEMQDFMDRHKTEREAAGRPYFEMRVGIHTGPVVAGIVGMKKFQYDIWGDTVNTASRMESAGAVGQVNISGATHALVKDAADLTFTPRGRVHAKGKGDMEMFFVHLRGGSAAARRFADHDRPGIRLPGPPLGR